MDGGVPTRPDLRTAPTSLRLGWVGASTLGVVLLTIGPLSAQLPKDFAALRHQLASVDSAGHVVRIAAFLVDREASDPETLRARLLLASHHLRAFALREATIEFSAIITSAPRRERDLIARGLYGLAQCHELRGRSAECRTALQRLHREFRDLRHARFAAASLARLQSRSVAQIGRASPQFTVRDLAGRVQSSDARLGHPVLLAFFSAADPRSVARVSDLLAAWTAGGGRVENALVFAVDADATRLRKLVANRRWRGPVIPCFGAFLEPVLLQFRVHAIPDAFLIGPDGVLLQHSPRPGALRRALDLLR